MRAPRSSLGGVDVGPRIWRHVVRVPLDAHEVAHEAAVGQACMRGAIHLEVPVRQHGRPALSTVLRPVHSLAIARAVAGVAARAGHPLAARERGRRSKRRQTLIETSAHLAGTHAPSAAAGVAANLRNHMVARRWQEK